MIFGIIVAVAMGFTAGSVATVQNPELHKFTKEQVIEQKYKGEKHD